MNLAVSDIERRASAGDSDAQLMVARQFMVEGQREKAEAWLRRATESGSAEATWTLGQFLLSSPPPVARAVIDEGRNLVLSAAHAGNGAAAHFAAVMASLDNGLDNRWTFALSYLGRSAKAGYRPAQSELALLAADRRVANAVAKGESLPAETWHRLHDSIDPAKWLSVPEPRTVSTMPYISVAENFLSPEICDWIVSRARPKLVRGQTYNQAAKPLEGVGLTGTQSFPDLDLVVLTVMQRIAGLTRLAMNGLEPTAVLNYSVGQQFPLHYDFLEPTAPTFAAEIARTGQRLATVLIYLNDDFEGGETAFPKIGFRFKGRKGDALMYHNIGPSGEPDRLTLHAGLAPTRGEKWLFAKACTIIGRQTW